MFQKINLSLEDLDYFKLKGKIVFDLPTFKEYSIKDLDYLNETLYKKVKFTNKPFANITEILYPGASPHTDKWPTAINFYFDIGDDETFFWKEHQPTISFKKKLTIYNKDTLDQVSSFKANKGDCYLINVGQCIHSVKMYAPNTTRKILRLFWFNRSFDQVLNDLNTL